MQFDSKYIDIEVVWVKLEILYYDGTTQTRILELNTENGVIVKYE